MDCEEKAQRLITCSVCLEELRHPHMLPCLHSFCGKCIYPLVNFERHVLRCPMDRIEHHASKVKYDFRMVEIIEVVKDLMKKDEKAVKKEEEDEKSSTVRDMMLTFIQ